MIRFLPVLFLLPTTALADPFPSRYTIGFLQGKEPDVLHLEARSEICAVLTYSNSGDENSMPAVRNMEVEGGGFHIQVIISINKEIRAETLRVIAIDRGLTVYPQEAQASDGSDVIVWVCRDDVVTG